MILVIRHINYLFLEDSPCKKVEQSVTRGRQRREKL